MASCLRPRCVVVVVAATLALAFLIVLQPVRGLINDDDVCGSRKTCYDCMCADGGLSPCDSTGRQSCAWCGGSCVQRSLTSSLQCGDSGDVYPPSSSYNDDDMRPTVEAQCDVPARKPNLTPCCDASLFPNHSLTSATHFSLSSIGNGCLYNSESARGRHRFGHSPYSSLCSSPQPVTRSSGEDTDTTGNNPMLPVCLTPLRCIQLLDRRVQAVRSQSIPMFHAMLAADERLLWVGCSTQWSPPSYEELKARAKCFCNCATFWIAFGVPMPFFLPALVNLAVGNALRVLVKSGRGYQML